MLTEGRLLDLARITIVCENLVTLERILRWLLAPERGKCFQCCRTKDRLSRKWDAEVSGGNRDIMINGCMPHPALCDVDLRAPSDASISR